MLRLLCLAALLLPVLAQAQADDAADKKQLQTPAPYSAHTLRDYPRRLYWGDTHLHTRLSSDAGNMGNVRLGPDDAYRFARGETVRAHNGMNVRLGRPLDFLVVADHAEHLGLLPALAAGDPLLLKNAMGRRLLQLFQSGNRAQLGREVFAATVAGRKMLPAEFTRSVWGKSLASAERYNEPGVFTALLGYEWTSSRDGANLHRVVIFRDGPEKAGAVLPFSSLDSARPEDLWNFLSRYARETGGDALAIPHNSNLSAGRMFALKGGDGRELRASEATLRARWEPLAEVTQYKGDSETHPFVSPQDPFADYGTWDRQSGIDPSRPHEDWMYAGEYLRPALKRGLLLHSRLGVNPFRFGMIAGTDSHTSLAVAEEDNFWGKYVVGEPSPGRALRPMMTSLTGSRRQQALGNWVLLASGYTAIWAHENTRAALFDALRRREVYATTGPRIAVRFFGGWDFHRRDAQRPDLARTGYERGVPMGGVLSPAPGDDARPSFLLQAARDPVGANLDRVQVVKGWLDRRGQLREKVYDAAVSGNRRIGRGGQTRRDVGNTVDLKTASYSNSIGAPLLTTVWQDPGFDPREAAFYYVRVIEIPTPRWTAYDEVRFGDRLPASVPRITRERAYTSPIWYSPPR